MTNQGIKQWRKSLDLTQQEAAKKLGTTKRGYQFCEAGTRPDGWKRPDDWPLTIPHSIALACAAIQVGPEPL
jgi:DNA-binding XRE family transcriptional regulator